MKSKTTKRPTVAKKPDALLSDDERSAIREYVRERKAARGGKATAADGEAEVLAKIAEMPELDRVIGERLHALIKATAPGLTPRTWYGMPAYARDGNVVCYFQNASKFKARYAMLGFSDKAKLDDGNMWPVAYAIDKLTRTDEARIKELIKRAAA